MTALRVMKAAAASLVAAAAVVTPSMVFAPVASADCPDIEVVFARGTDDTGGLGAVGGAFVDALQRQGRRPLRRLLRRQLPRDLRLPPGRRRRQRRQRPRAVHDGRLPQHPAGARRLLAGRGRHGRHHRGTRADPGVRQPAASQRARLRRGGRRLRQPSAKFGDPLTIAPVWGPKSIDLCNGGDPICQTDGEAVTAHRSPNYTGGFVNQAADFVAGRSVAALNLDERVNSSANIGVMIIRVDRNSMDRIRRGLVAAVTATLVARACWSAVDPPAAMPSRRRRPPARRSKWSSPAADWSRPAPDRSATHSSARCAQDGQERPLYAVNYPADTEIDLGANDMSQHVQNMAKLPGHPDGAGRLLAGRRGHGCGAGRPVRGVRVQEAVAAGRGAPHRRGRPVRQRHPWAGPITNFNPVYSRADHRAVPRRRPDLQPDRPQQLGVELARPPGATPTSRPAWSTRPPTSSRAGSSRLRRAQVPGDRVRASSWSSGG